MSKFVCTIIHKKGEGYRANLEVNQKTIEGLPDYVDYRTLKEAIKQKTGIEILKRKDMLFERLSDFETVATIDATQTGDCRVTIKDRLNGWKPKWD